jgi:hypothetical protein
MKRAVENRYRSLARIVSGLAKGLETIECLIAAADDLLKPLLSGRQASPERIQLRLTLPDLLGLAHDGTGTGLKLVNLAAQIPSVFFKVQTLGLDRLREVQDDLVGTVHALSKRLHSRGDSRKFSALLCQHVAGFGGPRVDAGRDDHRVVQGGLHGHQHLTKLFDARRGDRLFRRGARQGRQLRRLGRRRLGKTGQLRLLRRQLSKRPL